VVDCHSDTYNIKTDAVMCLVSCTIHHKSLENRFFILIFHPLHERFRHQQLKRQHLY